MEIESKPLRKLLNFRSSELRQLGLFYLHALLSGLGLALLLTLSLIYFLENLGARNLPQTFVLTGVAMLLVGYMYARLEHRLKPTVLFRSVALAIILFLILLRINDSWLPAYYSALILFIGFYLINQVHNLEFWGVASLSFDVRQSKRLFPLLSSGESISKVVGYLIAPIIIQYAGLIELLSIAAVCFLASAWSLEFILKKHFINLNRGHDSTHHTGNGEARPKTHQVFVHLNNISKIFSGKYIRRISLLAGMAVIVQFIVTYAFLDQVQVAFEQRTELASFFAIFFAFAKMGNLIMKSFFTGRLYKRIGLLPLLLITPVGLFICLLAGGVTYFFNPVSLVFLIVFASGMFVEELFRTSAYKPSFLILFQPLLERKRLEGHTAVKGFVEPLGIILAGILLMIIVQIIGAGLKSMAIMLLVMTCFWILMTVLVNREYVATLMNSLVKRTFRSDVSLDVIPGISDYLLERLKSRDLRDVDYALKMLGTYDPELCDRQIAERLKEDSMPPERVKVFLKQATFSKNGQLISYIEPYLSKQDVEVRAAAVLAYASQAEQGRLDRILPYLNDKSLRVQKAAVRGLIQFGGIYGSMHGGPVWLEWIENQDLSKRLAAVALFEEIGNPAFYHPLEKLLRDSHPQVRLAALKSSRSVINVALIEPILDNLYLGAAPAAVIKTLEVYGKDAVEVVYLRLVESGDINKKIGLIRFLVKHIDSLTKDQWLSLFDSSSLRIRNEVWRLFAVKGLYFLPRQELIDRFDEELLRYTILLECLLRVKHRHKSSLKRAIEAELITIRFNILNLACLITQEKGLCVVAETLSINKNQISPNALDTIESLCHKSVKDKVLVLFEQNINNQQRYFAKEFKQWSSLRDLELFGRVCRLSSKLSDWLLANMVHYEGKTLLAAEPDLMESFALKPSRVLCEQLYEIYRKSDDPLLKQYKLFQEEPFSAWVKDFDKENDKPILSI